jgi:hypothetical protein
MLTLGLALALLAQAEPAAPGNEQIRHSLKLPNLEGVPAADDKGQQLKIASFRWGPRQSTSADGTGAAADGSPPPQGSVIVKTEWPWTACQVGASYPSLSLFGGKEGYLVENLTVSKCGNVAGAPVESVTFDYQKLTVGTWDPQKRAVVAGEPKPR